MWNSNLVTCFLGKLTTKAYSELPPFAYGEISIAVYDVKGKPGDIRIVLVMRILLSMVLPMQGYTDSVMIGRNGSSRLQEKPVQDCAKYM